MRDVQDEVVSVGSCNVAGSESRPGKKRLSARLVTYVTCTDVPTNCNTNVECSSSQYVAT